MIVLLHFISHGGMGEHFAPGSIADHCIELLRSACICAVNVFVLISGYFLIGKTSLNVKRFLSIAISIWFYAWIYLALARGFGLVSFSLKDTITSLLPISFRLYWFPTCYLCMYLLSPFLNSFLQKLSFKTYALFLTLLFLLFSVWSELVPMSDPLNVVGGYSIAWFVFLYCLAGFIRLYGEKLFAKWTAKTWLAAYLISVLLIFAASMLMDVLSSRISFIADYGLERHFSRYCSILVLAESVSLFMLFQSVSVKGRAVCKAVLMISPLTFGVYLLHDNANIRSFLYQDVLQLQALPDGMAAIPMMLGLVLFLFVACCAVEYVRRAVAWLIQYNGWYNRLCAKAQSRIDRIFEND